MIKIRFEKYKKITCDIQKLDYYLVSIHSVQFYDVILQLFCISLLFRQAQLQVLNPPNRHTCNVELYENDSFYFQA